MSVCCGDVGVALIGSGQVAQALARQIDARGTHAGGTTLSLRQAINARASLRLQRADWLPTLTRLAAQPRLTRADPVPQLADDIDVVVDLSASDAVAAEHAIWLRRGIAVITANKRGLGGAAERAHAIHAAIREPSDYGDAATVGAGLGAVRRLRELHACGEPVLSIAGVLSGTLAWLFDQFDGSQPFSTLVRQAHALGYTEPDPRDDVGGGDVLRKLRILARAVGWPVSDEFIVMDPRLHCAHGSDPWPDIQALDSGLAALIAERPAPSARLAVVARATPEQGRIGIEWLAADDPLAQRSGCDNAIVIHSQRYRDRPLVLRGPGAGPELTAAAVYEDLWVAIRGRRGQQQAA